MAMGEEEFCSQAVHAGVDGVIVPDMPPEESDLLCQASVKSRWACAHFPFSANEHEVSASGGYQAYKGVYLLCFDHRYHWCETQRYEGC